MDILNYIEIIFEPVTNEQSALLTAVLSHAGFEGFEEGAATLKAYIPEIHFDKEGFKAIIQQYPFNYHQQIIQPENWNAVWEESFEPVVVDDFVVIRAHFHKPSNAKVAHELVITPKMSFGTGHHATTYMMLRQMQNIDFRNKGVLDFGTGTGILAVLAERLGAEHILAVDIDEWSIKNAAETIEQNGCIKIQLYKSDGIAGTAKFDIVLANINKNIILQHIEVLSNCLNKNGYLLLSGLLIADEPDVLSEALPEGLTHINTISKEQWISMLFSR